MQLAQIKLPFLSDPTRQRGSFGPMSIAIG
jgi:hypothetical protein